MGRPACKHAVLGVVWRYTSGQCKQCHRAKRLEKIANDPAYRETLRARDKTRYPKRKVTMIQQKRIRDGMIFDGRTVEEMLETQKWCCDACGERLAENGWAIDHCHTTGYVRAAVHLACNSGGGMFGDDAARLRRHADYIDRHTTRIAALLAQNQAS